MTNTHTKNGSASGSSQGSQEPAVEIVELLRKVGDDLSRGVGVGWAIFNQLERIDESLVAFAIQKGQELIEKRQSGATTE